MDPITIGLIGIGLYAATRKKTNTAAAQAADEAVLDCLPEMLDETKDWAAATHEVDAKLVAFIRGMGLEGGGTGYQGGFVAWLDTKAIKATRQADGSISELGHGDPLRFVGRAAITDLSNAWNVYEHAIVEAGKKLDWAAADAALKAFEKELRLFDKKRKDAALALAEETFQAVTGRLGDIGQTLQAHVKRDLDNFILAYTQEQKQQQFAATSGKISVSVASLCASAGGPVGWIAGAISLAAAALWYLGASYHQDLLNKIEHDQGPEAIKRHAQAIADAIMTGPDGVKLGSEKAIALRMASLEANIEGTIAAALDYYKWACEMPIKTGLNPAPMRPAKNSQGVNVLGAEELEPLGEFSGDLVETFHRFLDPFYAEDVPAVVEPVAVPWQQQESPNSMANLEAAYQANLARQATIPDDIVYPASTPDGTIFHSAKTGKDYRYTVTSHGLFQSGELVEVQATVADQAAAAAAYTGAVDSRAEAGTAEIKRLWAAVNDAYSLPPAGNGEQYVTTRAAWAAAGHDQRLALVTWRAPFTVSAMDENDPVIQSIDFVAAGNTPEPKEPWGSQSFDQWGNVLPPA